MTKKHERTGIVLGDYFLSQEEQDSLNFSLEEFLTIARPTGPVPLIFNDSRETTASVKQTLRAVSDAGVSYMPIPQRSSILFDLLDDLADPDVALYLPHHCFCCEQDKSVPQRLGRRKIGLILPKDKLDKTGANHSFPKMLLEVTDQGYSAEKKIASKDLSLIAGYGKPTPEGGWCEREDSTPFFTRPEEATFFRVYYEQND